MTLASHQEDTQMLDNDDDEEEGFQGQTNDQVRYMLNNRIIHDINIYK